MTLNRPSNLVAFSKYSFFEDIPNGVNLKWQHHETLTEWYKFQVFNLCNTFFYKKNNIFISIRFVFPSTSAKITDLKKN